MLSATLNTLAAHEADVVSLPTSGSVVVRDADGTETACALLQTAGGDPLVLAEGDRVLVAVFDEAGYVLGRVAPHRPSPADPTRIVEIIVPEGVETVRIAGRRITIAADESLSLECGGGSVRIDRRGKVVVLGTEITSRAKRQHKIKGASVAIN